MQIILWTENIQEVLKPSTFVLKSMQLDCGLAILWHHMFSDVHCVFRFILIIVKFKYWNLFGTAEKDGSHMRKCWDRSSITTCKN